jgi:hypothetical protein
VSKRESNNTTSDTRQPRIEIPPITTAVSTGTGRDGPCRAPAARRSGRERCRRSREQPAQQLQHDGDQPDIDPRQERGYRLGGAASPLRSRA